MRVINCEPLSNPGAEAVWFGINIQISDARDCSGYDCFGLLNRLQRLSGMTTVILKGGAMKAAMIFTGSGPILILTSFDSLEDPTLSEKLGARGITRYIAYEVSVDKVKKLYGARFSIILGDLSQTDDLRVMDIDGHHVFNSFSFEELEPPIYYPSMGKTAKA
jgi:hypothetical protein